MKKISFAYTILTFVIALGACNDPIFHYISVEPPKAEPRIGGSPTNFVVFKNLMYVASGNKIFCYLNLEPQGKKWEELTPGGRIMQLAATDDYLYALCYQESERNAVLKRISDPIEIKVDVEGTKSCEIHNNWEDAAVEKGDYNMLQSVYAAGKTVFIGAQNKITGSFGILIIGDDTTPAAFNPLMTESTTGLLCGIAYDSTDYYLCTNAIPVKVDESYVSTPIYIVNSLSYSLTPLTKSSESSIGSFTGIINLDTTNGSNKIVAISRAGKLYTMTSTTITEVPNVSIGENHFSTGALAIWTDGTSKLLLAGRQDSLTYTIDSGYTYGYKELELDATGEIKAGSNFVEPGKNLPSSVGDDNARYVSTIGKNPVNYIFQPSGSTPGAGIIFASTQKNGVWSYRERKDVFYWNAEE